MRILLLATAALLVASAPASAQSGVEGRVGKLESEMRAVQRKVFPAGAGGYLQPEVEAAASTGPIPGSPAASAVTDLQSRVSSLESQMATLTGQIEQAGHRARQAQDAFDAYRRATDARLKALEAKPVAAAEGGSVSTAVDDEAPAPVSAPRAAAKSATQSRAPAATTAAKPVKADAPAAEPERDGKAVAVAKPDTGDAAEDAYTYGYRLWQAKRYPEAQAALKQAATDYPKSKRYSYAQNLLGRAYLDDGKPSLASMAFYENYKKMPDGERAPESLYYLAQALQKLNKPADACKVYDELSDVYGAKMGARMKTDVASGRVTAKCK